MLKGAHYALQNVAFSKDPSFPYHKLEIQTFRVQNIFIRPRLPLIWNRLNHAEMEFGHNCKNNCHSALNNALH